MNAIRRTPRTPAPTNSKKPYRAMDEWTNIPSNFGEKKTTPKTTSKKDRGWEPAHTRFNAPKPPKQPNLLQRFWNSVTGGNK